MKKFFLLFIMCLFNHILPMQKLTLLKNCIIKHYELNNRNPYFYLTYFIFVIFVISSKNNKDIIKNLSSENKKKEDLIECLNNEISHNNTIATNYFLASKIYINDLTTELADVEKKSSCFENENKLLSEQNVLLTKEYTNLIEKPTPQENIQLTQNILLLYGLKNKHKTIDPKIIAYCFMCTLENNTKQITTDELDDTIIKFPSNLNKIKDEKFLNFYKNVCGEYQKYFKQYGLNIKFEDQKQEQQVQNQNNLFLNHEDKNNLYCRQSSGTLEYLEKQPEKKNIHNQKNYFNFENIYINILAKHQQNFLNRSYNNAIEELMKNQIKNIANKFIQKKNKLTKNSNYNYYSSIFNICNYNQFQK